MIRLTINKAVFEARVLQLVLIGCILGAIYVIAGIVPWWEVWLGYKLLILVSLGFVITALVIAIGHIGDRVKTGE